MVPETGQLKKFLPLLFAPALFAGDYYLSYHLYSSRFLIVEERIRISRAMVPFEKKGETICTFFSASEDFPSFARRNEEKLLECLFEHGIIVRARDETVDLVNRRESLELLLPPIPLQVEFNDGLVIIRKVKSEK
ncbi:hypothetical protein [Hydrogenimonas sp.]